jgi:NAD(P)-dependent dehydrogenase (short-subunit alcohol dehydrogenase family)
MDVRSEDSVSGALDEIARTEGRLDVLVNNSGVFSVSPQEELTEEDWDKVFDTNIKGLWSVCRRALPSLRASAPSASSISPASTHSIPASGVTAHYTDASKGGGGLVHQGARRGGRWSRRAVNAIAPGLIDAPYLRRRAMSLAPSIVHGRCWARLVDPSEVASVAVFLAGARSSGSVGQTITVDCGYLLR